MNNCKNTGYVGEIQNEDMYVVKQDEINKPLGTNGPADKKWLRQNSRHTYVLCR